MRPSLWIVYVGELPVCTKVIVEQNVQLCGLVVTNTHFVAWTVSGEAYDADTVLREEHGIHTQPLEYHICSLERSAWSPHKISHLSQAEVHRYIHQLREHVYVLGVDGRRQGVADGLHGDRLGE